MRSRWEHSSRQAGQVQSAEARRSFELEVLTPQLWVFEVKLDRRSPIELAGVLHAKRHSAMMINTGRGIDRVDVSALMGSKTPVHLFSVPRRKMFFIEPAHAIPSRTLDIHAESERRWNFFGGTGTELLKSKIHALYGLFNVDPPLRRSPERQVP